MARASGGDSVGQDRDDDGGDRDRPGGEAKNVNRGDQTDRRSDYAPEGVAPKTGFFATAKRTFTEFSEDSMTDQAAALTYYGLLSLFPMLIALVSIIGLVGDPVTTTKKITDIVTSVGPKSAASTFSGPIKSITQQKSAAGILFVVGLASALWAASGYIGAFMRAANIAYETPEGRKFFKLRPLQMLITLVIVIILAVVALGLVLSGPVVKQVATPLGIGSTAVSIWNIAKWPVMLLLVLLAFSILYYAAPNVKLPKFTVVTPGVIFALIVWVIASILFAFYVANFGSYNKTYGTLGGVVSFLVWLWITNCALLLGLEMNAERERSRELDRGVEGAEREIQLDARDAPKDMKTT